MQNTEIHKQKMINGIPIDIGFISMIKNLWKAGVRTYECCEGGINEEEDYAENGYLIIHKDDFKIAKSLIPKGYEIEKGSAGYNLADYTSNPPDNKDIITFIWRHIPKIEHKPTQTFSDFWENPTEESEERRLSELDSFYKRHPEWAVEDKWQGKDHERQAAAIRRQQRNKKLK